jgi:hypothetical protein
VAVGVHVSEIWHTGNRSKVLASVMAKYYIQ